MTADVHGSRPSARAIRCCAGLALGVTLGVTLVLACLAPAEAADRYGYRGGPRHQGGWVEAHSRWGNGSVSAPVRSGRHGWQVRLPGGTWVDCARSCSDTLRRQTVDFWEANGPQAKDDGPGYFRWGFRFYR